MNFSKAVKLSLSNVFLLLCSFVFHILSIGFVVSVSALVLQDQFYEIVNVVFTSGLDGQVEKLFTELSKNNFSTTTFVTILGGIFETLKITVIDKLISPGAYQLTYFVGLFSIFFGMAIVGLNDLPTGFSLNQYMMNNKRSIYVINYFDKIVSSLKYQIVNMFVLVIPCIATIMGIISAYIFVFSAISITGLIITYFLIIVAMSIYVTISAWWLPVYVTGSGKGIFASLKESIKYILDDFTSIFLQMLAINGLSILIILCVVNFFGLLAGAIAFVIVLPLNTYFRTSLSFVSYYEYKNMPYYVSKLKMKINKVY